MNIKDLNRELTMEELEVITGGVLSPEEQKDLLANMQLVKNAGHSMESCIITLCVLSQKEDRDEVEAFIRANW